MIEWGNDLVINDFEPAREIAMKQFCQQQTEAFMRGWNMYCDEIHWKLSRKKRLEQPDPDPSRVDIFGDYLEIHTLRVPKDAQLYALENEGRRAKANYLWVQYCKKRGMEPLLTDDAYGAGAPGIKYHHGFGEHGHLFVAVFDDFYHRLILYWSFRS